MRILSGKIIPVALILLLATAAHAAGNPHGNGNNGHDNQHGQTRRYALQPQPELSGARLLRAELPPGYYTTHYHGSSTTNGGAWYRPYGPRNRGGSADRHWSKFLPPFYTTVVWRLPYYYADDTYYMYRPERREYVVTQPPAGTAQVGAEPNGREEIYVYPKTARASSSSRQIVMDAIAGPRINRRSHAATGQRGRM
jgi:hypothetical protein